MTTNSPPSGSPADKYDLRGLLRLWQTKTLQKTDDMLPARVIAYNRATNLAKVQPLISVVTTSQEQVPRAQIASVPVFQYGGGGFVLSFPVRTGDTGWIKANDRDISLFKQTMQANPPNTQRKHSFEDAMFFPDTLLNGVTIESEDAANAVFQNYAGTVKISLWDNLIKILAPQGVGIGGTPNPNAILDLQTTTQAFLPPRLTTAQKNAIPSPTEGMTVYDKDEKGLSTYNGSVWS